MSGPYRPGVGLLDAARPSGQRGPDHDESGSHSEGDREADYVAASGVNLPGGPAAHAEAATSLRAVRGRWAARPAHWKAAAVADSSEDDRQALPAQEGGVRGLLSET